VSINGVPIQGENMKCPYCDVRVSYFNALKISRWKNHVCLNCGGESSSMTGNVVLMVACVLVPLFSIDMLFSSLQQPLHWGLYTALAILLSYIAHRYIGKLQKT
jgi:DNA-directed RNA polymerase subunit RPC12/RpoP